MRNRIEVRLATTDRPLKIGTLIQDNQHTYFRCCEEYLSSCVDVSPIKLPKAAEVQRVNTPVFEGLYGVFADSLPDGWGRLLLDRTLTEKGISLERINMLDRLAFVGENGMGALTYHPVARQPSPGDTAIDLDQLADESRQLLAGERIEVLDRLVELGSYSGGARPKIVVGYNPTTDEVCPDAVQLPQGFEHWLIKFPASIDPVGVAGTEYAYYRMALAAGLEMMPCKLFSGRSGSRYFGTKRFDRQGADRLHLHSAAGLMHDNFRLTDMDYGHVMDAALRLENELGAPKKVLRLAAFNVFAHNRDDHSKNVSFLMDQRGRWRLAPAYDLTYSQSGHGYHSMTVAGEGLKPGKGHLLELAADFNLSDAEKVIAEVEYAVKSWADFAEEAGVKSILRKEITKGLRNNN